jgi:hypothetical protein
VTASTLPASPGTVLATPGSVLAHSCWPGLAHATPADEDSRPATGEQDEQQQAMHSVINVAPPTLRPRRQFVARTGRRFLPVSREPPAG